MRSLLRVIFMLHIAGFVWLPASRSSSTSSLLLPAPPHPAIHARSLRPPHVPSAITVEATAYSSGADGCCAGVRWPRDRWTGRVTAVPTVAVSHDLLRLMGHRVVLPSRSFVIRAAGGTIIRLSNRSPYWVRDLMAGRWANRIDVYMPNPSTARLWGRQRVTIQILW
jgi:3D (Asp-Asp-Asp) domain-containing protein